jgi:hypothetical protein
MLKRGQVVNAFFTIAILVVIGDTALDDSIDA